MHTLSQNEEHFQKENLLKIYVTFSWPIMAHTQILTRRWGPQQGFQHCFADRLNQSLVAPVALAIVNRPA